MQICHDHWTQLKEAIEVRGLMHLVAKNGQAATEVIKQHALGNVRAFDPLLRANFSIWNNSLQSFGLEMLATAGECPLCYLDECVKAGCGDPECTLRHDGADDWIRYAADDELNEARRRGLAPEAS